MAAANYREAKLNQLLPPIQRKFEDCLNEGVLLELDAGDTSWLTDSLEEALGQV